MLHVHFGVPNVHVVSCGAAGRFLFLLMSLATAARVQVKSFLAFAHIQMELHEAVVQGPNRRSRWTIAWCLHALDWLDRFRCAAASGFPAGREEAACVVWLACMSVCVYFYVSS